MKIFISADDNIKIIPNPVLNKIKTYIKQQHKFLVGDAPGFDDALQHFLWSENAYNNTTVYFSRREWSEDRPRCYITSHDLKPVKTIASENTEKFYAAKEYAMTRTADIVMIITNNTLKNNNFKRAQNMHKDIIVYNIADDTWQEN